MVRTSVLRGLTWIESIEFAMGQVGALALREYLKWVALVEVSGPDKYNLCQF